MSLSLGDIELLVDLATLGLLLDILNDAIAIPVAAPPPAVILAISFSEQGYRDYCYRSSFFSSGCRSPSE